MPDNTELLKRYNELDELIEFHKEKATEAIDNVNILPIVRTRDGFVGVPASTDEVLNIILTIL